MSGTFDNDCVLQRRWQFFGRVQGVGFRATSHRIAKAFPVDGYVRNMPDGSVEILAQGDEKSLNGFLEAIQNALGAYIVERIDSQADALRASNPGFEIRY